MQRAINTVDGVSVAFRTAGRRAGDADAPPLILLHPTALSRAVWPTFSYVRGLADIRTLVLMDLRGHGASGKPHDESSYAMERFVGDVEAVAHELDTDTVDLCGYSLGSRVALAFAARHPHRVGHLVLGGTSSRPQHRSFDRLFFPDAAGVLARDGLREFVRRWEERRGTPLDDATRAAFTANDSIALAAYMRELDRDPGVADAVLADLAIPTLAFVGDGDTERLPDTRHVAETIPGARLLVIDGADHATALAAHDVVIPAIRELLLR